jgi:hypothetical protein
MTNPADSIPHDFGTVINPLPGLVADSPDAVPVGAKHPSVVEASGSEPPPDPDDLLAPGNIDRLKQSQDFGQLTPTRAVLTNIPIRKPGRHEWVWARSGEDWEFNTLVFRDREANEDYLVSPLLLSELSSEVVPVSLVLFQSRSTPVPCIWPVRIPDSDKPNRWHTSAIECVDLSRSRWVRIASDPAAGLYVPHVTDADLPGPIWDPGLAMDDYVRLAFKGRVIAASDHPVLRRLRGEV